MHTCLPGGYKLRERQRQEVGRVGGRGGAEVGSGCAVNTSVYERRGLDDTTPTLKLCGCMWHAVISSGVVFFVVAFSAVFPVVCRRASLGGCVCVGVCVLPSVHPIPSYVGCRPILFF